ncbi:quinone oxidoreductase family protein [Undibacterium sp. Di27W]|uniref:quinone oxidoreductase family protein n=1 Tax=Undibacterium sp. Di27W TaxID=3413036 RepID=UPI003BF43CEF
MKAAIVVEAGQPPIYGDFKEAVAGDGEVRVKIVAAALSPVVKSRASGRHYSATGSLPFVVGIDGVGLLEDGQRVYFALPRSPFGSMAESSVVRAAQCIRLPEALDDVTAAAIANPGMSAWAAMKERAKLVAGETVLINGATGTAGRLAVQIAKYLGAKKVIATGRNRQALQALQAIGADVVIPLGDDRQMMEAAFQQQFAAGVDVVVDYLWGQSAELLIIAAARAGQEAVPVRFIQVGSASGEDIQLPSAALRSSALVLMGSGIGSIPPERLFASIGEVLQAAVPGRFEIAVETAALSTVAENWTRESAMPRLVLTMG